MLSSRGCDQPPPKAVRRAEVAVLVVQLLLLRYPLARRLPVSIISNVTGILCLYIQEFNIQDIDSTLKGKNQPAKNQGRPEGYLIKTAPLSTCYCFTSLSVNKRKCPRKDKCGIVECIDLILFSLFIPHLTFECPSRSLLSYIKNLISTQLTNGCLLKAQ